MPQPPRVTARHLAPCVAVLVASLLCGGCATGHAKVRPVAAASARANGVSVQDLAAALGCTAEITVDAEELREGACGAGAAGLPDRDLHRRRGPVRVAGGVPRVRRYLPGRRPVGGHRRLRRSPGAAAGAPRRQGGDRRRARPRARGRRSRRGQPATPTPATTPPATGTRATGTRATTPHTAMPRRATPPTAPGTVRHPGSGTARGTLEVRPRPSGPRGTGRAVRPGWTGTPGRLRRGHERLCPRGTRGRRTAAHALERAAAGGLPRVRPRPPDPPPLDTGILERRVHPRQRRRGPAADGEPAAARGGARRDGPPQEDFRTGRDAVGPGRDDPHGPPPERGGGLRGRRERAADQPGHRRGGPRHAASA